MAVDGGDVGDIDVEHGLGSSYSVVNVVKELLSKDIVEESGV